MAPGDKQADPSRERRGPLPSIIPTTALGLAGVLFLMSLAAAFSGAVLYAYYQSKQEDTTNKVEAFVGGFGDQLDAARKIIQDDGDRTKADIEDQLAELRQFAAAGGTLADLVAKIQPSMLFVSTLDDTGAPSVGSAFVAFSDSSSSYALTSYTTVLAATRQPGPGITVRRGDDQVDASLVTWDAGRDLALLRIDEPNLPALAWADNSSAAKLGDRLFAVSGLGSAGAGITQGFAVDVSADGVQHDVPIGVQFQGGPLVNADGEVIGIASRRYSPLGFVPDTVFFSPLIRSACEVVLSCPSGDPAVPG